MQFVRKARRIPQRLREWGFKRIVVASYLTVVGGLRYWLWDLWHGVETRREVAYLDLGLQDTCYADDPAKYIYSGWNGDYAPASHLFSGRVRKLALDWSSFIYIDLGSGKGKTLLLASEFPFRRVIGVEFSADLVKISRDNLQNARNFDRRCKDVEVVAGDAIRYQFPSDPLVIYCFNPFPPVVFAKILKNLKSSYLQNPRIVYLLFLPTPPAIQELINAAGFLKLIDTNGPYHVYRSNPALTETA